jgi:hypothetical protein
MSPIKAIVNNARSQRRVRRIARDLDRRITWLEQRVALERLHRLEEHAASVIRDEQRLVRTITREARHGGEKA